MLTTNFNEKSKISVTIDGWISITNKSFYEITAYFVDSNWELQSVVFRFYPFYNTQKKIFLQFFKKHKTLYGRIANFYGKQ